MKPVPQRVCFLPPANLLNRSGHQIKIGQEISLWEQPLQSKKAFPLKKEKALKHRTYF
jgi:hypothetical protein